MLYFPRALFLYALYVADVQQVGLGAALGLAVVALKDVALAALKKRNGSSAGDQPPSYWEVAIRRIVEDVMDRRNATVREIVQNVIDEELARRGL